MAAQVSGDCGREQRRFTDRVADAVGRTPDVVAETFDWGVFMSAQEALDFGLIDEICRPKGARPGLRVSPG